MRAPLLAALVVAAALAGCAASPPAPGADPTGCASRDAGGVQDFRAERAQVRLATSKGDITLALDVERAPITAGNFLNLTRSGYYDGTAFHRVVEGFVIQGGDPRSKNDDPADDGTGGPGYDIPDEFNPTLRHDGEGVLSMATGGPDTGGSQFFITLTKTESLDDRHSVFGRVAAGMDVVRAIAEAPTRGEVPVEPVVVTKAEEIAPAAFDACHAIALHPIVAQKKTEPGRPATFAVLVKNEGTTRDQPTLVAHAPPGWNVAVEPVPVIPAGTGRIVFVRVTPTADAEGTQGVHLLATSAWPNATAAESGVAITLGALGPGVQRGERIQANYVGVLPDGRLFDTSVRDIAMDPDQPKFDTPGGFSLRPANQYVPFTFTVGDRVIEGFTTLATSGKVGETVTARIPAAQAYASGDMYQRPLTGRDLVFELEILAKA